MKKIALLLPLALLLPALPCAAQGPLTPPGPPAPTMKTLEQIEPRTPISSLPYTITEPGSYYVVSNLHSTTDGIVIEVSGVTVDLMGFSLTGDGTSGDYGIHVVGATDAVIDKVVIRNGTVSGFFWGFYCQYMNNSRIEQMVVSGNNSIGVYLNGWDGGECNGNTIANCSISDNAGTGVYLNGSSDGECNGNTISDCSISDNSTGVSLVSFGGQCKGNTISDCTVSGNSNYGVYLDGDGGQCEGNTIRGNTISKNGPVGVYLFYANRNRMEANHVAGTMQAMGAGIRTSETTNNFILGNTCVNHETNFSIDPDDTFVPVETASLAGQATIETAITAVEPRTPISSLPYPITEPGSYYVVSNLHSTTDGIVIETNSVTVDLMGFSLTGDGTSGDYGIHVAGATNAVIDKVVIRNGTVSGFNWGLHCQYMNNSRIEQMVVSGNNDIGVYLDGDNSGQCNGNTIADCSISGNGSTAVYLDGDDSGQCNGNRIANCSISDNTGSGVYLRGFNSGQCNGNTIRENTLSKNTNQGIYIFHADGNRVEANTIWGTGGGASYGIRTDTTTGNFILKNTCVGQTNNFDLSVNDTYGPIVTNAGALAGTDPWANFSR